jgi:hypothetical protein
MYSFKKTFRQELSGDEEIEALSFQRMKDAVSWDGSRKLPNCPRISMV